MRTTRLPPPAGPAACGAGGAENNSAGLGGMYAGHVVRDRDGGREVH